MVEVEGGIFGTQLRNSRYEYGGIVECTALLSILVLLLKF